MYIFLQKLPTMNILDPNFIARCSTILASDLPEITPNYHTASLSHVFSTTNPTLYCNHDWKLPRAKMKFVTLNIFT